MKKVKRCEARSILLLAWLFLVIFVVLAVADEEPEDSSGRFTGETIFRIYATDVEASATFYRDVLGFQFLGYYDYAANAYTPTWQDSIPPIYAGFVAGKQKFGLHKPGDESQEACVGCGVFYFRVRDVDLEYNRISALGIPVGDIRSTPLLRRFMMLDPDGNKVFFAETAEGAPLNPW